MKPISQPFQSLLNTLGRRRNILSALVLGMLFLMGVSTKSHAAAPGTPVFDTYIINVPINNAIANGTDIDKVTVQVLDGSGNPVLGLNITFSFGGLNFPASTDGLGTYYFVPSSNTVGLRTVTVKLNGIDIGSANINFVAGPPSTSNSATQLILDHSPETANGVNQDLIHLHIVDQWGNVLRNTSITNVSFFVVNTGDPSEGTAVLVGGGSNVSTDGNGDVFLTVTNTKAGTVRIGASINGNVVGNVVDAVFIAGDPDVTRPETKLVVDISPSPADGVTADKIHAHLVDANDNVVANRTVTMTFSINPSGSADATAVLTYTATGTTDANGNVYLTITNTKTGTVQIVATVNGNAITHGSPAPAVFIAGDPDVTRPETKLVVDISPSPADGVTADKIHAHLVDANDNIVANKMVTMTFTVTPSGPADATAVLTYTATGMTDANGDVYLLITNTVVGTVKIIATVNGNAITNGSPAPVAFTNNNPVANPPNSAADPTYYIVVSDNAIANGIAQNTVKVHLTDNTNIVPNWPVTFTIVGGSAASTAFFVSGGTQVGNTITVNTDPITGDILLPIVDTKVGDVIITATITVGGNTVSLTNSPRTVHFVVGPPDPNPPGNPTGGTTFWVSQDNAVADNIQQDMLNAHISDATGNHVGAGVLVEFTIIGGNAAANALFNYGGTPTPVTITLATDANGDIVFPMIDKTAGAVIVSAKLGGVEIHNSPQTAHFIAGPAVPTAPNAPSGLGTMLTVTQDNVAADGKKTDIINAHITDQYGNAVSNEVVTFTIIAGGTATAGALFQPGGVATTVTAKTDVNGNAVVDISNTIAGDVWVVASIVYGGTPTLIDGSHVIAHFTEAPDVDRDETRLIVVVYQALADGNAVTVVKAHIVDHAGNPLPGWDVTFKVDSGNAKILLPQPVTTDANGDVSIALTSTTPGYALITATVNGDSIKNGSPARVKFVPINIYVPRVFSPNNDGTNDQLKPILVGIQTFHYFSVYNRWGNLIFTTRDANKGWDGTFKGVAQPVETYLWIAEGVDVSGKTIVQKGMTSLVR